MLVDIVAVLLMLDRRAMMAALEKLTNDALRGIMDGYWPEPKGDMLVDLASIEYYKRLYNVLQGKEEDINNNLYHARVENYRKDALITDLTRKVDRLQAEIDRLKNPDKYVVTDNEVHIALNFGRTHAVKAYRERTRLGLRECMDAIDDRMRSLGYVRSDGGYVLLSND